MDDFGLTPKQDAILVFESLGFHLIKLNGKIPLTKEWEKLTKSEIALDHPRNYGVALNSETVVIDVDAKSGGAASYKKLLKDLGMPDTAAFNTLAVNSGNKGLHVYLRKPKGLNTKYKDKNYPGIEFRSEGMQMVGPYSIHPDTHRTYTFRDDTRSISDAPQALLDLIKKSDELPTTALTQTTQDTDTITRFIKYLQDEAPATEGEGGDNFTFIVACQGKDLGLSQDSTYSLMMQWWNEKCVPPWAATDLYTKVTNAYNHGSKPIGHKSPEAQFKAIEDDDSLAIDMHWDHKGKTAELRPTLNNIVNYFKLPEVGLRGMLRYNQLSREIEFVKPAPWHNGSETQRTWCDSDAINGKYFLSASRKFDVSVQLIHEAATVSAFATKYNPLTNYLDAIEWDGVERIGSWLTDFLGADSSIYTRVVGRKMLIAAVARAYRPGIKFDHVLVLEGAQGVGKSTACQILGGRWYADANLDPSSKDAVSVIQGKWIVELSEMTTTRKSEADALKAFISRQEDRVRAAYARTTEDYPRTCIFIGTINPEENMGYLKDRTGSRRFWPVLVHQLKKAKFEKVVDQLWAEAKVAFQAGEELYIVDPETHMMALFESNKRKVADPWFHTVDSYVSSMKDIEGNVLDVFFVEDIWADAIKGDTARFSTSDKARLCSIMRELGFEGKQVNYNGKQRYGYVLPETKPDRGVYEE